MEIENIKKNQSEMNTTLTETQNTSERINSRLDKEENQISDLEGTVADNTQSE